jgi:hypothetical protein
LALITIGALLICIATFPSLTFRYSTKGISHRERVDKALIGSFGKRLTYRRTAALGAYSRRRIGTARKRWTLR